MGTAINMNRLEMLPTEYLERMKSLFVSEYDDFINSYEDEPLKALRFNPLKVREETVIKLINEWGLKRVPWCQDGYYYGGDIRPGLSPYHAAGVFYIQEPSAMITAEEADIGPVRGSRRQKHPGCRQSGDTYFQRADTKTRKDIKLKYRKAWAFQCDSNIRLS